MAVSISQLLTALVVLCSMLFSFWLGKYRGEQNNILEKDQTSMNPARDVPVLTRLDPVEVGYVREMQLVSGKVHKIKTLSMRPALFEIEDFLSDDECEEIINMAKEEGFEDSEVHMVDPQSAPLKVHNVDKNANGVIDKDEFRELLFLIGALDLTDTDAMKLMDEYDFDSDNNGVLSYAEYHAMLKEDVYQELVKSINSLRDSYNPQQQIRSSSVTWLRETADHIIPLLERLRSRMQVVTGLPRDIIWSSEDLQVAKYNEYGHYHCHYDSGAGQANGKTCCHYDVTSDIDDCVPCRYLTFFYYLNVPEEGGETAFPIADDMNTTAKLLFKEKSHLCNLSKSCQKASISYKPKRGAALFWYNHHINDETGWLGPLDGHSVHGGCDVIKGTKWAANSWINVGKDRLKDEKAWADHKQYVRDYDNVS